jgi:hypothetical protein
MMTTNLLLHKTTTTTTHGNIFDYFHLFDAVALETWPKQQLVQ